MKLIRKAKNAIAIICDVLRLSAGPNRSPAELAEDGWLVACQRMSDAEFELVRAYARRCAYGKSEPSQVEFVRSATVAYSMLANFGRVGAWYREELEKLGKVGPHG